MAPYDIFFFGALFFLAGVLFASLELKVMILSITAILAAIFLLVGFLLKKKKFIWLFSLSFLIIFGALYYQGDNEQFSRNKIPFNERISFSGFIINQPVVKISSQEFYLQLSLPYKGNVLVKTSLYPRFNYGSELELSGVIKKPEPAGYADYLAKEGISGNTAFPEINLIGENGGSVVKNVLFKIKNKVVGVFQEILPQKEGAFLTGLILGGRSEFSDEFKKAMSLSGTTHLVALSGYNITIIIWAMMGFLTYFFRRRLSFFIALFVIFGFVIMTGAESSVVRAAIMGVLVLFSREIGRLYDFRNAIVLAALAMVLENPKVLVFDVGFQLSFLAILGIVYLRPVLQKLLRFKDDPGFLSWRDNFLTTTSAQLAVMPLLISNFGAFSPVSLLANILILELIPLTMAFGFLIVAGSFLSYYFALVLGWFVWVFLKLEISLIEFFAEISLPISVKLGWAMAVVYYCFLGVLIWSVNRKRKNA